MHARIWRFSVLTLLWLSTAGGAAGQQLEIEYRGKRALAETTAEDQKGAKFTITGMSGITCCGGDNYIAVMDNSNKLVALKVTYQDDGAIQDVAVVAGRSLVDARDYEGIAYTDPDHHSVLLSDESTTKPTAIYEYRLSTGALQQKIVLPPIFGTQRPNFGMESLTRRPDGGEVWTANEEALAADGEQSTPEAGSIVRLQRLRFDGKTYTPGEQYAYVTDPIHVGSGQSPSRSGVSDLVELPDGTLLVLERSCGIGLPPFRTAVYQVDFTGATDISRPPLDTGLNGFARGQDYRPVSKKLLLASGAIGENLEGLCLGPTLANGNRVLLGVVDDGGTTDTFSGNTLVSFVMVAVHRSDISTPLVGAAAGLGCAGAAVVIGLLGRVKRKRSRSGAAQSHA